MPLKDAVLWTLPIKVYTYVCTHIVSVRFETHDPLHLKETVVFVVADRVHVRCTVVVDGVHVYSAPAMPALRRTSQEKAL